MKKRPNCWFCGNPALMVLFDKYVCGNCVVKWDKNRKEKMLKDMEELVK